MDIKDYQLEGIEWIKKLPIRCGGILADEMGLGKSVQSLLGFSNLNSILIICNKTLFRHWENEINKWLPDEYNIYIYSKKNLEKYINDKNKKVLIVNYDKIRKLRDYLYHIDDRKERKHFIKQFEGVILDEGQKVKNWLTSNYNHLDYLINNLLYSKRLILSGTPIVNNRQEILRLLELINIEVGSYLIGRYKIYKKRKCFIDITEEEYQKIIKKWVLSRTKNDVGIQLPMVEMHPFYIKPNEWQEMGLKKIKRENDTGDSGWKMIVNQKEICITPYLINKWNFILPVISPKIEILLELIDKHLKNDEKILIFSQYERVLDFISDLIEDIPHKKISGRVKLKDRYKIVDEFQNGEYDILLLTYGVGGEGLNLTRANVVIMMDLWWTWASFIQALNRVHRFGQDKKVLVYRLITDKTIENKIVEIINKKKDLLDDLK